MSTLPASLWLCLRFPLLALEARFAQADLPCAVFETRGNRPLIAVRSAAAAKAGVAVGQGLSAAQALLPSLQLSARRPDEERAALRALAARAYGFSAQISLGLPPQTPLPMLWCEIASSRRLFGGLKSLLAKVRAEFSEAGHAFELGVAPTPEAAALVGARGLPPILEPASLAGALAAVPVGALPLDEETRAGLAQAGIRRLDQLWQLPVDGLALRYGQPLGDWLRRLLGQLPDARRLWQPPPQYRRRFEFDGRIENLEALRFVLRRLLLEFERYLIARDTGVQEFTLVFEHEDPPASEVRVGLASAARDSAHLQAVVQARLERWSFPAPVTALALRAERFAPVTVKQGDLFDEKSREDGEWSELLDRLRARLGTEAVRYLQLRADHRPEKSWSAAAEPQREAPAPQSHRPLWLLPQPRPLAALPELLTHTERIESGWWDGLDVARDYFEAHAASGAKLWVFKERASGAWFLQGLYG